MQTWYRYDGRDIAECKRTLNDAVRSNFEGDLDIEPSFGEVRAFIRMGMDRPLVMKRSVNYAGISFRRSWHHIRERKAAAWILYYVIHGEIRRVNARGTCVAQAGQFLLIDTDEPFYTRTIVGERGNFECALVIIPEHLALSHLRGAKDCDTALEIDAAHRQVVLSLLDLLCFEGAHVGPKTAELLAGAFLEAIAESIGERIESPVQFDHLVDKRFADIQACIQRYLTSPELTCNRVADHCGISPRYVCYVLKTKNTSFSELLWKQRLSRARDWLIAPEFRCSPINRVASQAGFKSPAHFSRMFKSAYGESPKEFRARNATPPGIAAA